MLMPLKNQKHVKYESDDEDDEENRTLFCANIDERVTEDVLYEVFLQAGPIERVRIPKDQSGRQRTFGFVTYVHACTIPYALQLFQGLSLYRKNITIKFNGSSNPSPMRNTNISPGYNEKHTIYDNSSLRGSNYISPHNNNTPVNPFAVNSLPDFSLNSMMPQHNTGISSQRRPQSNSTPYKRGTSSNNDRRREHERDRDRDRDYDRDHDRRRSYNNGSTRHTDQRSGCKGRR